MLSIPVNEKVTTGQGVREHGEVTLQGTGENIIYYSTTNTRIEFIGKHSPSRTNWLLLFARSWNNDKEGAVEGYFY